MMTRRGFSLIELLLTLVMVGVISLTLYRMLQSAQRVSRAQAERVDMQQAMRAGALILPLELSELGFDSVTTGTTGRTDIRDMSATSIRFRAARSTGLMCDVGLNWIAVDTARLYSGYRLPAPGRDSLMLFADRNTASGLDDSWLRRPLTAVSATTCPGGRPGLRLATAISAAGAADSFRRGSPFRTYELMEYSLGTSAGEPVLLARSVSGGGTAQPVLGPLAPGGLRFEYFDGLGNPTSTRSEVRAIRLTIITRSQTPISLAGGSQLVSPTDSLTTTVMLRNARRP